MVRRRKNKKKVDGFVFPVPFAGLVVLFSAFALCYVWLGCRCEALGVEIKALESENDALNKKYLNEEYKWTRMKSPRNLERVLRERNIVMSWPRRDQVVRLYDTSKYQSGYAKLDRAVMNE